MTRRLAAAFCALALGGCSPWTHVASTWRIVETDMFSFMVPSGWSYIRRHHDEILATRDGPGIHRVTTRWYEWHRVLYAGDRSGQNIRPEMAPHDIAAQLIAAHQRERGWEGYEIVSLDPAQFVDASGFRVVYAGRDERGLRMRVASYGAIRPEGVFFMTYEAPHLHFYERDLDSFDEFAASGRALTARERAGFRTY